MRIRDTADVEVYPRVCGGTRPAATNPSTRYGLSPRVRGNRALKIHGQGIYRSIPACAGEPSVGAW